MRISVSHDFLPRHSSVRASQVMDHFGITFEQGRHVVAAGLELPIEPGQVVLFTGTSGSGKSSLMRAVRERLLKQTTTESSEARKPDATPRVEQPGPRVVSLDDLPLPAELLIDSLNLPAAEAMNLLSTCGLGEAHLMLRTPTELSDGQRYRFRLALALSQRPAWVLADEFTATLDRTLAKVVAYNIRRLADRTDTGFLLATTHEDVAEDLDPDVHIRCRLDGEVRIHRRTDNTATNSADASAGPQSPSGKKKRSPSPPNSGSPRRPGTTGRTSLGGITAAITSASRAG